MSFWQTVRLVARREIVERSRQKSFLISTGVTLLIVLGFLLLPLLFGFGDPLTPTYRVAFADGAQRYVDAARVVAKQSGVKLEVVQADPRAARSEVADGDLDAYVEGERIVANDELEGDLEHVLQGANQRVRAVQRLASAGIDPAAVAQAQAVAPLPVDALDPPDPPDPDAAAAEGIVFVGTIVLYAQLLGYGFWVAMGIVEEKSSRVVEVLLATVRPRALLAGKVLGIGLLALAQLLVIAVIGLAGAALADVIELSTEAVAPVLILLGWFVLGFAFYACLFAAGAARVSRQEDVQSVTTPAAMLVMLSFFGAFYAGNNPDALAGRVLGILPPFSALVFPVSVVGGDAMAWEIALAVGLMLLAVAALIAVAARIYEGSVLRMGGTVSWREAWRSRRLH
jgi:ABC-2 type transport system permease protein